MGVCRTAIGVHTAVLSLCTAVLPLGIPTAALHTVTRSAPDLQNSHLFQRCCRFPASLSCPAQPHLLPTRPPAAACIGPFYVSVLQKPLLRLSAHQFACSCMCCSAAEDACTSLCLPFPTNWPSPKKYLARREYSFLLPASGWTESSPSSSVGSQKSASWADRCFCLSLQHFISLFFAMSLFPLLSYSISLSPSPFVFNLLILSHIHHLLLAEVLFALCLKTSILARWVPSRCLSLVIDQFTQTLKAMRPSGPSWPASPATTAPTRGAPLSTAAAAQVQPAFSPECRIARRCLALSYTALTYICPALFPAAQTTGCLLRQRSPSIFVLVCWLWKMGAPPEVLSLSQRRAWTADLALPEGQPG